MKRKCYIICILLLGVLFSFVGCGASNKITYISKEELAACSTGVAELNKDNWEQFFMVKPGNAVEIKTSAYREKVTKDSFVLRPGCVMLNETTELLLTGKRQGTMEKIYLDTMETENTAIGPTDITLELVFDISEIQLPFAEREYERDRGLSVIDENGKSRDISLIRKTEVVSLECLHASGRMMTWDIPEEYWNVEEEDVRFLCIGDENVSFRVYELTFHYDMVRYLKKYGEVEQE